MSCRLVRRHMSVYLDGELDPTSQIEFERHLATCGECGERAATERAFFGSVRDALAAPSAPPDLRARIEAALAHAPAPLPAVAPDRGRWLRAWHALPVSAAAAVILLGVAVFVDPATQTTGGTQQAATSALLPIFEDVVRLHSSGLPADVSGDAPQKVARYFQGKLEFPVRPAQFGEQDVRLIGGRVSNVRAYRAAALYYDAHGRRVTVVVFPERPTIIERGAQRFRLGRDEVVYHRVNGYTVPVRHHDGLNYVFTGDMEGESILRLAASSRIQY